MESKTINEWLVIKKVLAERKSDLKTIREPQYDTKAIDRRVTEIQNAELAVDAAIKQSNAIQIISVNVDVEKLLSPME